jgi:para-aminobenzoate synthetase component 1
MPLFSERLSAWTSLSDTFVSFFGHLPGAFWLDGEHHPTARYSVIGAGVPAKEFRPSMAVEALDVPFSFRPGYIGVIHYGSSAKDMREHELLSVDRAFVYDHDAKAMYFIGDFETREAFDDWHRAALLRLALVGGECSSYELSKPAATSAELAAVDSRADYLAKIRRVKDHIAAGDVYQLCLTTKLRGEFTGDPLSFFLRLRREHPAPYASFIRLPGSTYASISPELFISAHGSRIVSSPIKGTRSRSEDLERDQELMNQLGSDLKERAENLMIVDLIRNDMSVACDPESIQVENLLAIRSYSTVHQLVSDVSGVLSEGNTSLDALAALFPGGSMTGAPKIRAMELIEKLEVEKRAGYSGAIGWIAQSGDMELGMVIRTAIFEDDKVSIGIGGGITSDSAPEAEHEEIQLKATALASTLGAQLRW